jgi:putative ribosome biogenesis GTPase RsgA
MNVQIGDVILQAIEPIIVLNKIDLIDQIDNS